MTGRLRPWEAIDDFQHKASDYLYEHDEALALLETGAGKTMIAMTAGHELMRDGHVKRPLVFAPLRVAQINWPGERFEWQHLADVEMTCWGGEPANWTPSIWRESRLLWGQREHAEHRLPNIRDPRERRALEERIADLKRREKRVNAEARRTLPPEHWHVTSFENVMWLTDLYDPGESPFDLWIIDETGKVARNPKSPRYKALKKHMPKAKIRWGMNATPAPEGAEDLFGQVQVVDGGKLWGKSFYGWRQKFFVPDYMGYVWTLQYGAFDRLMADLNTLAFRVPAEALVYQKNIRHSQIPVELPPKARAAYDEMEKRMAAEMAEGNIVTALSEASASMKLRQITQGYLYEVDAQGRRTVHILHEEKLHAVADLIDSMGREPLLIAYQFDQDLENLRKIWKNIPYLGAGVDERDAASHIERLNKRELPVLALHPNCLHPYTLVLTEYRGWIRLVDVQDDDRVFDGVEFVSHSGCHLSGIRPVVDCFGIIMTPDHLILINDQWHKAEDVQNSRSAREAARYAYAHDEDGAGSVPSLWRRTSNEKATSRSRKSAGAKEMPRMFGSQTASYVLHSAVQGLARRSESMLTTVRSVFQTLRWTWNIARSKMGRIQKFLAGHVADIRRRPDYRAYRCERPVFQSQLLLGNKIRSAGQQTYYAHRSIPRTENALSRVLPCDQRDSGRDNALSGLVWGRQSGRGNGRLQGIRLPSETKEPQKVYDLVDCGPRHRFVVRNADGEMFIVHNSASHGLNLQYGCHHICWMALPWGLDPYKQTNERIDRRGQEHACYGHHIVALNSKDQDVSNALLDKDVTQAQIIAAVRKVG